MEGLDFLSEYILAVKKSMPQMSHNLQLKGLFPLLITCLPGSSISLLPPHPQGHIILHIASLGGEQNSQLEVCFPPHAYYSHTIIKLKNP